MAAGAEELAARMKRISDLTEQLMAIEQENAEAHSLAARIHDEIASVREQLRHAASGNAAKSSRHAR